MKTIVEARNLNHTFGKGLLQKQVLINVSLNLFIGEIAILEGPSGSGKTTLLSLIGALRSAQKGSLKVLGKELLGAKKKHLIQIRNQIGFIFQDHHLLTCLKVWENVSLPLKLHSHIPRSEYRSRSADFLSAVGLSQFLDYYPGQLSGGQKQRVAVARALTSRPKLVLADEPTASLDSQSGRKVVDTMQKLAKEEGCTVLLVTHDNRILDVADRIFRMEDGCLLNS
ncbi:ATP-binding cassette domain-containing protein [Leptothoe sp. EHU-05/26/07-4]